MLGTGNIFFVYQGARGKGDSGIDIPGEFFVLIHSVL